MSFILSIEEMKKVKDYKTRYFKIDAFVSNQIKHENFYDIIHSIETL